MLTLCWPPIHLSLIPKIHHLLFVLFFFASVKVLRFFCIDYCYSLLATSIASSSALFILSQHWQQTNSLSSNTFISLRLFKDFPEPSLYIKKKIMIDTIHYDLKPVYIFQQVSTLKICFLGLLLMLYLLGFSHKSENSNMYFNWENLI